MNKTKIAWTDYTWNPVTGCSKISEGCKNCYAEAMMSRFNWSLEIQFHPERLEEPLHRKKPAKIFVCSMGDLFHENVWFEWVDKVMAKVSLSPRHAFQILTKRPGRALEYFENLDAKKIIDKSFELYGIEAETFAANWINGWSMPKEIKSDGNPCDGSKTRWPLPNLWLGVTAENQRWADERIPTLLQIPAAVRFVSLEPLLEEVNISQWMPPFENCDHYAGGCTRPENVFAETGNPRSRSGIVSCKPEYCVFGRRGLDWVIVGAETGPGRRECKIEWVRSIVQQCADAAVPCFVKQIKVNGKISHDMSQWPEDLRVRQWPETESEAGDE